MRGWRVLGVVLVAELVLRGAMFWRSVLDWDESLYAVMAQQWLGGHLPYTIVWDNKPLGIYAIFALFEGVFRNPVVAIRVATVIFAAGGAVGIWRLAWVLGVGGDEGARGRLAVLAGAACVLGGLSNDGLSANTELFMECFSCWAVLLACEGGAGFWVGLLFGAAVMVKYVAVFEAPAVGFALLAFAPGGVRVGRVVGAAVGFFVLPVLIVVVYWFAGDLGVWWRCSVAANLVRVGVPFSVSQLHNVGVLILPRWWGMIVGGAGVLAWWRAWGRGRVVVVLWLLGGLVGVASAKSFYDHYFLQILPVLCLAMAMVLGWLWDVGLGRGWRFVGLCWVLLVVPAWVGGVAEGDALRPVLLGGGDVPGLIARAVGPAVRAGAVVYVFDDEPIIYALAGAAPPTRYVLPSVLTKCVLARVAGVFGAVEVARVMAGDPEFVVRISTPLSDAAIVDEAVYVEMDAALAARYFVWRRYEGSVIYRLRAGVTAPVGSSADAPDGCTASAVLG